MHTLQQLLFKNSQNKSNTTKALTLFLSEDVLLFTLVEGQFICTALGVTEAHPVCSLYVRNVQAPTHISALLPITVLVSSAPLTTELSKMKF